MNRGYVFAAAGAALAVLSSLAGPARTETPFTSLTAFGDSYADTGSPPGGTFRLFGAPCPPGPAIGFGGLVYPTCRFSNGTNLVDSLQALYGLAGHTNYAFGGALTAGGFLPGFLTQIAIFTASGGRFGQSDLIALSIGGNDQSLMNSGMTLAQIAALATTAAGNAVTGVGQLSALGARNIAWVSPGNPFYFPAPFGDPLLTQAQRTEWARSYFEQVQRGLAPLAAAGLRVFLFDLETLQARVQADPTAYGFASASACSLVLGAAGCSAASNAVKDSFFYYDTIHPTSAGFHLIARYMQNQIEAPLAVAPQGDVIQAAAGGLSSLVFNHLDAYRSVNGLAAGQAQLAPPASLSYRAPTLRALAASNGAAGAPGSWAVWVEGHFGHGSGDEQFYADSFDYRAPGVTVGLEHQPSAHVRYGIASSFTDIDVKLAQKAHYDVNAYQIAGYASAAFPHAFADALVAYGFHDFETTRPGIVDIIRGETDGNTVTAAAKAGFLFHAEQIAIGPIADLTYVWSRIDGYTEAGDSLLTMIVDRQTIESLTGSAGVQLRFPRAMGRSLYSPFINATVEHDFIGSGRTITTTQVTTPLSPVLTPLADRDRTYAKVAGGLAVNVAGNADFMLSGFSTFERGDRNDFGVSAGLRAGF